LKKIIIITILIVAFITSCKFEDFGKSSSEVMPEGFRGSLEGLVVGLPRAEGSGLSEVRTVFSTDEIKHAVRGFWIPGNDKKKFDAHFVWLDPDGNVAYEKVFNIDPTWKNTTIHYRGKGPLKAGQWTLAVKVDDMYLGKIDFKVVRDSSKIPLKAQIKAFKSEKITINEAHFITEKLRDFADGKIEKDALIKDIPSNLAGRKVGLAVSVFRKGELKDIAFSSAKELASSIKEILSTIRPVKDGKASIELSIIHSGLKVSASNHVITSKMRQNMGFSMNKGGKSATILPTQIARKQFGDATGLLRQLSIDAGLNEDGWKGADITAFMTQDFVLSDNMTETKELAYSRTVVPVDSVSRDELVKSVDNAIDWYLNNQLEDGRYMYTFFPSKDLEPNDDWALRNLNGIFVLSEIAKDKNNEKLIAGIRKVIETFRQALVEKDGNKYLDWKKHRPVSSIAGTAFLLGAMVELYIPDYKDDMKKMADAIIALQEDNGKLRTDFYRPLRDIDQLYYPGETLLTLIRYYKLSKYEPAKKAVEKAFPFYLEFWDDNKEGPFVPWQIRAYQELYQVSPQKKYADFVFDLMDWMLKRYKPVGKEAGYGREGAFSTQFASTAVYSEGLSQAYALALEIKDKKHIELYSKALKGTLGYLLGLQFKEEDVYWVKRPGKVVGAIALRPDINELRLDATYHAISAIHYSTKLMSEKHWNSIVR